VAGRAQAGGRPAVIGRRNLRLRRDSLRCRFCAVPLDGPPVYRGASVPTRECPEWLTSLYQPARRFQRLYVAIRAV
jgi:hypothetical protein